MKNLIKIISPFLAIAFLFQQSSCSDEENEKVRCKMEVSKKRVTVLDTIRFEISPKTEIENFNSEYFFDGKAIEKTWFSMDGQPLGKHRLSANLLVNDSVVCNSYKTIEVISEITPEKWEYEVLNQYPHQTGAYTQGLTWHEGYLLEGTGQYESSILAKVKLSTGSYENEIKIGDDFFGEGVTILNDKIYQLTWQSQICFVYDLNSFELIDQFEFKSREGWGLTTDGKSLIMSNGTNQLIFIDPESKKEIKKLEVYSGKRKQMNLNELEFVQGLIFANIYQSDEIAIIEGFSGKVIAFLDCSRLLNKINVKEKIDVLNGIAYNPENAHIYLTGKWWPTLFEIRLDQISPIP